ncbi:hypothetical protein A7E59_00170 [Staphylococcus carnosus]|nr:hypothetical protein A7E59_00170 [Staphylococcus carnosus]SUM04691.1 high affinity proline permease [Staphylococcus carnosus]
MCNDISEIIGFVKTLGEYSDFFNLYEIIPGFLTSLIVTYIVSLITKKPNRDVEKELEEVKKLVKEK